MLTMEITTSLSVSGSAETTIMPVQQAVTSLQVHNRRKSESRH